MTDTKLPTLHEIRGDILTQLQSDEPDQDKLNALLPTLEQKIDNYAAFCKNKQAEKKILQASIDIYKDEIKKLEEEQLIIDKKTNWLALEARRVMQELDQLKVETPMHKVRIQDNPPKVIIKNEGQLDPMWVDIIETVRINKKAIINNYKETGEIPKGADIIITQRTVFK